MAACWAQHASSRRLLSSERPSAAAAPFTHPPNTASHTTSTQQDPVQDMHPSAYSSDFHIQQTVPGSSTSTVSGSENRDPHSGSSSKTALQIPVIEPGGVGSGGAAQGRRVMKPPGRRAAAAVAAVHLGPHATSGIAKPAAQTAVARPTAVFKQVSRSLHVVCIYIYIYAADLCSQCLPSTNLQCSPEPGYATCPCNRIDCRIQSGLTATLKLILLIALFNKCKHCNPGCQSTPTRLQASPTPCAYMQKLLAG